MNKLDRNQAVYLLVYSQYPVVFVAVLAAAAFTGGYAVVMSRVLKAVSTIFLSISIFPLIPGASLYYLMYGIVIRNRELTQVFMEQLVIICLSKLVRSSGFRSGSISLI